MAKPKGRIKKRIKKRAKKQSKKEFNYALPLAVIIGVLIIMSFSQDSITGDYQRPKSTPKMPDGGTTSVDCGNATDTTGTIPETECNNGDDDCDGQIDEDIVPRLTSNQLGECAGNTETCVSGTWVESEGNYVPTLTDDYCFDGGKDTNCDGSDGDISRPPEPCPIGPNVACGDGICQNIAGHIETCKSCPEDCSNEPNCFDNQIEFIDPVQGGIKTIKEGDKVMRIRIATMLEMGCYAEPPYHQWLKTEGGSPGTSHSLTYRSADFGASQIWDTDYTIKYSCYTRGMRDSFSRTNYFTVEYGEPEPPAEADVEPLAEEPITDADVPVEESDLDAQLAQLAQQGEETAETFESTTSQIGESSRGSSFAGVGETPYCGNNKCDTGEDCEICSTDCGQCPTVAAAPTLDEGGDVDEDADSDGGVPWVPIGGAAGATGASYVLLRMLMKRRAAKALTATAAPQQLVQPTQPQPTQPSNIPSEYYQSPTA